MCKPTYTASIETIHACEDILLGYRSLQQLTDPSGEGNLPHVNALLWRLNAQFERFIDDLMVAASDACKASSK